MATSWNSALATRAKSRGIDLGALSPTAALGGHWPAWSWKLILIVAAAEIVWLVSTPLSVAAASWLSIAGILVAALAFLVLGPRLADRPRLHTLAAGATIAMVSWPALRLLNHVTMSSGFPLADPQLAAIDAALGLDWLAYMRWLDGHPGLVAAMDLVYGSLSFYSCVAFLILLAARGPERAREFVLLFLAMAVASIVIGMFVPATGAMVHYAPDPGLFQAIRADAGTYFWPPLQQLRSRPDLSLDLANLPGLVALPSFHTAMGVAMIWCSRGGLRLFIPSLAVNLLMIASTPLFGGHYFVDVFAGAALAAAAAWALTRFQPELP